MDQVLVPLQLVATLGSVVCCILVWVKMFQYGETTRAIIYIATTFLCGVGALLTLFWGVRKHTEWNLQTVMNIWAVCIVLNILVVLGRVAMAQQ